MKGPRALALAGLALAIVLWTVWVIFVAVKMSPFDWSDRAVWLLALAFATLVGWVPLYATGLAIHVLRRGLSRLHPRYCNISRWRASPGRPASLSS